MNTTLPDRIPTALSATNVEPALIDKKYTYTLLSKSVEANLDLFAKVKELFNYDIIMAPAWLGFLIRGTAELGTVFQIDDYRVPYSIEYPIKGMDDVKKIEVPEKASGYLKMYLDIFHEATRRFPDTTFNLGMDGPWDLAMLLRGDQHLPMDFRLYRDYSEADDIIRREKIQTYGDPFLWPAIMELATMLSIRFFQFAVDSGISLRGSWLVDQYAQVPILSVDDYVKYALPYAEHVWKILDKKTTVFYMMDSPQEFERWLDHPILGDRKTGIFNYIYPQDPYGVTLPELDEPTFEITMKLNVPYVYMIHGKFIRDSTEDELEKLIKRVCGMAIQKRAKMTIFMASVPLGTDLRKVEMVPALVDNYGRY